MFFSFEKNINYWEFFSFTLLSSFLALVLQNRLCYIHFPDEKTWSSDSVLTTSQLVNSGAVWFKLRPIGVQSTCFSHCRSLLVLAHGELSCPIPTALKSLPYSITLSFHSLPLRPVSSPRLYRHSKVDHLLLPLPYLVTQGWLGTQKAHSTDRVWPVDWLVEWNPVYSPEAAQQEGTAAGQAGWAPGPQFMWMGGPGRLPQNPLWGWAEASISMPFCLGGIAPRPPGKSVCLTSFYRWTVSRDRI